MAKDPAFLFYSNDFLTGVQDLTMEERGLYITLLCIQHQKGFITEKMLRLCHGINSVDVLAKFSRDKEGNYFNERLNIEIEKRKIHSEKQREKARKRWDTNNNSSKEKDNATAYPVAMPLENENENENENRIVNEVKKPREKKESPFFEECKMIFMDYYKTNNQKYIWAPKDTKAVGGIIKQVKESLKERHGESPPPEKVKELISVILTNLPEWYRNNANSVSIINSKYNDIINQIKNERKKQQPISASVADIMSKYYRKEG
jgi:uncharacterized protein YdaU (DUF1376 family)